MLSALCISIQKIWSIDTWLVRFCSGQIKVEKPSATFVLFSKNGRGIAVPTTISANLWCVSVKRIKQRSIWRKLSDCELWMRKSNIWKIRFGLFQTLNMLMLPWGLRYAVPDAIMMRCTLIRWHTSLLPKTWRYGTTSLTCASFVAIQQRR